MNEEFFRMVEIAQQEFYCSQILLMMGLEAQGKQNPELIRAMAGLVGGLGFCGKTCGSLTGGACLLALYAGKGSEEEVEDSRLNAMIRELVEWFEREQCANYGDINCERILENNPKNRLERCPQLVYATYEKVKAILAENGYDLAGQLEV
jgi:C_GCAxxG_C_C family probable redox protein